eukprot:g7160.t1
MRADSPSKQQKIQLLQHYDLSFTRKVKNTSRLSGGGMCIPLGNGWFKSRCEVCLTGIGDTGGNPSRVAGVSARQSKRGLCPTPQLKPSKLCYCFANMRVPMPDQHLFDTVRFLLSYQNGDGGWATYENNRGWSWYELLNPSEVFGDIMIDYSYVECSSSAMQALMLFTEQFPQHRAREIAGAIQRGARFIEAMQRSDGSWYGCWGNCFTYGCWFGIEGLPAPYYEAGAHLPLSRHV